MNEGIRGSDILRPCVYTETETGEGKDVHLCVDKYMVGWEKRYYI